MDRRDALKSVAYGLAGAGLVAVNGKEAWAEHPLTDASTTNRRAIRAPFIETHDGARLFYKEWGTGQPILFVHSWAVNGDLWQYQMIHLADQGMRCIAYDQRGHGRSIDPGSGYEYDTLSDDLAAVIEQLDLRGVTLVGHSMGCGTITRYLTRRGASRVKRAVLVSPTLPFLLKTENNPQGVDKMAFERLRAGWRKDFPKWVGENARPFFTAETSDGMVQWGISMVLQASLKALIDCNRADVETDFRDELPRLAVPTLIIHGDKDVSAPVDFTGRRTAALIPGSRLIVYEGAPHGLMLTHVERLNADLLAFIRGSDTP
jgi:pimeloyl-ACP methyl ester carboxylesterase